MLQQQYDFITDIRPNDAKGMTNSIDPDRTAV